MAPETQDTHKWDPVVSLPLRQAGVGEGWAREGVGKGASVSVLLEGGLASGSMGPAQEGPVFPSPLPPPRPDRLVLSPLL